MASNAFGNIVSSYGLKSNGVNAIDVIAGVPVRVWNYQGNPSVYVYAGSKENASAVAAKMKDAAQSAGIRAPKASRDTITFGFKSARYAVDHYQKIRELISANATSLTFDQCPYCFMGNCDVAGMFQGSSARRMHRQCFLGKRNIEMDKINNSEGNYLTGIICALIAGAVMVAIDAAMIIGSDEYYPFLFLILPLLVAGAFRLGRGPYGAKGTLCHVVISLLSMFSFFYILGTYRASLMYHVTMAEAAEYFGDIIAIITDSSFIKVVGELAALFLIGLVIAIFANPTRKSQGRKAVRQNDVFITPLSTVNTGFSGADTYHAYGSQNASNGYDTSYGTQSAYGTQTTYENQNAYGTQSTYENQNTYGSQSTYGDQNSYTGQNIYGAQNSGGDQAAQNNGSDWREVYGQHSDNNNNNSGY